MAVYNEIKAEYDAFEKRNFTCSKEKTAQFHELHNRSAYKCLDLARENGGIYNKAAQFAASLQGGAGERGIPEEYIKALRVCTDHAPGQPFSKIDAVIIEEFGMSGRQLFRQIDEVPIAAASLGQVHRAVCKDGTEVAVKIIYPELRRELASDFAVFKTLGSQIKPGGFDLQWLVKDFEDALKKELDFEGEARNAERCREMLSHLSNVRVPRVLWNFTRKSVVTTEFQGGLIRVDDHQVTFLPGILFSLHSAIFPSHSHYVYLHTM
jgi:aarF domain-containing kinase